MQTLTSSSNPSSWLGIVLAMTCAAAVPARADMAWHPDLPAALSASAASGKPVLVVFSAAWGDKATAAADQVLENAEVEAVLGACFEPVRLDVDAHADEAHELGIEHVPSACVLGAGRNRLYAFECPVTPAAFVAEAARAAQLAARANQPAAAAETFTPQFTRDAFGDAAKPPADATVAAVSDKVRQLSDFAEGGKPPQLEATRYANVTDASPARAAGLAAAGNDRGATPNATGISRPLPQWPAEQPASSLTSFQHGDDLQPAANAESTRSAQGDIQALSGVQAPATIEPQPASATPWLAASPPAGAGAPAPAANATGTDVPAQAPAAAPAEPSKKPETNGFLAALQKPWSIFSKSPAKPAAEPSAQPPAPPPTMPPALPKLAATLVGSQPAPADTHGPMPLGLEGYCPVTVVERGSWVEGRPQWGVRHRGRTYLFAGPEQQQAFLADPDRYAPALSGDDPVLAFEAGRSEPGRRAFGVSYQSRMYLFSSPETRAAFTADPGRYTARVMIAEGIAPADGIRRF